MERHSNRNRLCPNPNEAWWARRERTGTEQGEVVAGNERFIKHKEDSGTMRFSLKTGLGGQALLGLDER